MIQAILHLGIAILAQLFSDRYALNADSGTQHQVTLLDHVSETWGVVESSSSNGKGGGRLAGRVTISSSSGITPAPATSDSDSSTVGSPAFTGVAPSVPGSSSWIGDIFSTLEVETPLEPSLGEAEVFVLASLEDLVLGGLEDFVLGGRVPALDSPEG